MTCCCETIGAPPELRRCPEHFHFWRGDRRLKGITSLIRETWPIPPDFNAADPARLGNAKNRGVEVDGLLTSWLAGMLTEIPAGVMEDTRDLFRKLVDWWPFGEAQAQVVLDDGELVGVVDVLTGGGGGVWDLKTTYNLEPTYQLQVGGYVCLYETEHHRRPERCGIIHLTKRQKPKLVEFDPLIVASEFRAVRDMWQLCRRLGGLK